MLEHFLDDGEARGDVGDVELNFLPVDDATGLKRLADASFTASSRAQQRCRGCRRQLSRRSFVKIMGGMAAARRSRGDHATSMSYERLVYRAFVFSRRGRRFRRPSTYDTVRTPAAPTLTAFGANGLPGSLKALPILANQVVHRFISAACWALVSGICRYMKWQNALFSGDMSYGKIDLLDRFERRDLPMRP